MFTASASMKLLEPNTPQDMCNVVISTKPSNINKVEELNISKYRLLIISQHEVCSLQSVPTVITNPKREGWRLGCLKATDSRIPHVNISTPALFPPALFRFACPGQLDQWESPWWGDQEEGASYRELLDRPNASTQRLYNTHLRGMCRLQKDEQWLVLLIVLFS